jgi:hypothetical protein
VQTTKNNGRTNFVKLRAPLIFNRCEKRGRGAGLTNKASSNSTRPPALSGCWRNVNTFLHLRIKKCILPNDFSLFPHKYISIISTIISSKCVAGAAGSNVGRRIENRFDEGDFGFRSFSGFVVIS